MNDAAPGENNLLSQLCTACGLCCNGVIFADVELQAADDPARLAALGLPIRRKGKKKACPQPCVAFKGGLCAIYEGRPTRCRSFECGVLKRAQSGQATIPAALKTIARARRQAEAARKLMRELGQLDEHLPMTKRYQKIMAEPLDLSAGDQTVELRGELMMAVAGLMQTLEREFLD